MPIRYTKEILPLLKAAGYNTTRLRRERILSESTIQALRDGKVVSTDNLSRIVLCSIASQATFWSTQKMMPDKGDKMASTEAQKRAVKKAQAKCDAIMLRPPKEEARRSAPLPLLLGKVPSSMSYRRLGSAWSGSRGVIPGFSRSGRCYRLSTESWKSPCVDEAAAHPDKDPAPGLILPDFLRGHIRRLNALGAHPLFLSLHVDLRPALPGGEHPLALQLGQEGLDGGHQDALIVVGVGVPATYWSWMVVRRYR